MTAWRWLIICACASLWTLSTFICVWEWHVIGVCPEWSHQHDLAGLVGWLLAAALVLTWVALGLAARSVWRRR